MSITTLTASIVIFSLCFAGISLGVIMGKKKPLHTCSSRGINDDDGSGCMCHDDEQKCCKNHPPE